MENPKQSSIHDIVTVSAFETLLTCHEPFSCLLIRYLDIHEIIFIAQTNRSLREFIFSYSTIWRNFDVRFSTPEVIGTLRYGSNAKKYMSWDQSLLKWGEMMKLYQLNASPSQIHHNKCWGIEFDGPEDPVLVQAAPKLYIPYHSAEMTTKFLNSIFNNLKSGIYVVSLNLDAMPVTRNGLFAVTKRLEGTLKELSLRYCMKLEGRDLIDFLKQSTPEEEQETAFPMNLEKLHVSQFGLLFYSRDRSYNSLLSSEADAIWIQICRYLEAKSAMTPTGRFTAWRPICILS